MDIQVLVDFDRDGLFAHPLSDISARVRDNLFFTSGWQNVGQVESNVVAHVAPVNSAQLILANEDGDLAFERVGASFYNLLHSGLMVKFIITSNLISYTFVYYTSGMVEIPGQFGQQTVMLNCVCAMPRIQMAHYEPDVATDVLTSDALTTMMSKAIVTLPYTSSYFFIDSSEIDSSAKIFDPAADTADLVDFETGLTSIEYVGDVLHESRTGVDQQKAQLFIADICMAEAFGRFYYQPRDTKFHFHSRYHDRTQAVKLSISSAEYTQANSLTPPVYNQVRLHYNPREVGVAESILFSSEKVPIVLQAGTDKQVRVRYKDPDNEDVSISGLTVIDPVRGVDVIAEYDSEDITGQVFKSHELSGAGGVIYFSNQTENDVELTKVQVRGTPIKSYSEEISEASDGASMGLYNWMPLPDLRSTYLTNSDITDGAVELLVRRHATMRRVFESVTIIVTDDNFLDVMDITIGDVIQLQESWSAHDTQYVVLGEFHQYDIGLQRYTVTWYLRSHDTTPYFMIDSSLIDSNDLIGY